MLQKVNDSDLLEDLAKGAKAIGQAKVTIAEYDLAENTIHQPLPDFLKHGIKRWKRRECRFPTDNILYLYLNVAKLYLTNAPKIIATIDQFIVCPMRKQRTVLYDKNVIIITDQFSGKIM